MRSIAIVLSIISFLFLQQHRPTLYIIGDSTVRNTNRPQCGWGEVIGERFDTNRINISNQAMAGRSTRTFIKEGRWDRVMAAIQPGDYLIMQLCKIKKAAHPDGPLRKDRYELLLITRILLVGNGGVSQNFL
jgi:hypothetical protein